MTHGQVVAEIQHRARQRGILSHSCPDSRRCDGDRGLPDVLLAGLYGAAFVEVKGAGDELEPEQTTWKHTLKAAGQTWALMHEDDLADGGALDMLLLSLSEGIAP